MQGVGTTDRTQNITEILLKTGSALEEVFQYYKVGRHESTFTGKSYFLLSHCAHLLFSLRSADKDSGGALFQHASRPAAFLAELDYAPLRHADYNRRTHHADSLDDHLKNEPKWFDFWMGILERLDPRETHNHREFTQRVLTYVGYRGFLEGKAVRKNKKILDDLMKTVTAGRILLRTMSVLEDMIRVITSHFAAQDAKTCTPGQVTALACLLSQIRRTIVWEAPAKGPYVPRGAKSWRMPLSLVRLHFGATEGTLTLVPKREGGEIICSYHWLSKSACRCRSWTIKTSALKRTYEQELFATWSCETGEYLRDPGRLPWARTSWIVQNAEAERLENLSRQTELVLDALRTSLSCRGLVEAVRPILRNAATRWKATELPWTYVRQLDKLLNKLTFAAREAKVLGGDNPIKQVLRQSWPTQHPVKARTRGEPKPPRPREATTDESPAETATDTHSLPGPMTRLEQEEPTESPQPSPSETMAGEGVRGEGILPLQAAAVRRQGDPGPQTRTDASGSPTKRDESRLGTQDAGETQGRDGLATGQRDEPASPSTDEPQEADASEPASRTQPMELLMDRILSAEGLHGTSRDERTDRRPNTQQRKGPSDAPELTPPHDGLWDSTWRLATDPAPATTAASHAEKQQQPVCETNGPDTEAPSADDDSLVLRLLDYHRSLHGEAQHKPLSLMQLASDLGWNRTRVQRAMTDLFGPKPFTTYKERCKDRTIADLLDQLATNGTHPARPHACTTV